MNIMALTKVIFLQKVLLNVFEVYNIIRDLI